VQNLKNHEVGGIKAALDELEQEGAISSGKRPEVFYMTANKNVGARFFQEDFRNRNDLMNPMVGTVIDNTITEGSDFYLVS